MLFYYLVTIMPLLSEAKDALNQTELTCEMSLTPTISSLACQSDYFHKPYIIKISKTDPEILSSTSQLFQMFLGWTTIKNVISYECEKEVIFTDEEYQNIGEQCSENKNLLDGLIDLRHFIDLEDIKDLEISYFMCDKIYTSIYGELSTVRIHHIVIPGYIFFSFPYRHPYKISITYTNIQNFLYSDPFFFTTPLIELDLSHNKLTVLQDGIFRMLQNLTFLDLSYNEFFNVEHSVFSGLPRLKTLNLSHNYLSHLNWSTIPPDSVPDLSNLDLSYNAITLIPKDTFKNLHSLNFIDLRNNSLSNCYHFSEKKELQVLNLSHNRIYTFEKICYENLHKLKILNISSNLIKELKLCHFGSLEIIDASYNKIEIVSCMEEKNIRHLDLSHNKLKSFLYSSHLLPKLELLLLDYNDIQNANFLKELPYFLENNHTLTISVTFNKIFTFDATFLEEKEVDIVKTREYLSNDPYKISVNISFNPINCDCNAYYIKRYINKTPKLDFLKDFENINCAKPESLRNHPVYLLSDDNFICPITDACPQQCTCGVREHDKKVFVNCTNNQLHEVAKESPLGVTILYFNQNRLTNLSSLNSENWMNLTHLWMDDNYLKTMEGWNIPPNLRFLSVRGNKLKSLSNGLMHFIPKQTNCILYFAGNSRLCDCDSETFKQFLIRNPTKVLDINEIYCDFEENGKVLAHQLIKTSESELCAKEIALKHKQKIFNILASFLILLMIIALGLCVRHRKLINSFLYVYRRQLFCFFPDEVELKETIYDAFVAYSSSDRLLVLDLLNQLEQNEPFFKLCIHERDWMPGEIITETIVKSVRSSKRTIIILSESFLSSPWFKVELKAAISNEQMNPIIVIMVDKSISLKELDKEFQDAISKRTYLEWGERWFWKKLRYAMPRKACISKELIKT